MNPLGTRSRAHELAALLDDEFPPPFAVGVDLGIVSRLRSTAAGPAAATPGAEFRATLRTRLVAVARVQAAALAGRRGAWPRRRGRRHVIGRRRRGHWGGG